MLHVFIVKNVNLADNIVAHEKDYIYNFIINNLCISELFCFMGNKSNGKDSKI